MILLGSLFCSGIACEVCVAFDDTDMERAGLAGWAMTNGEGDGAAPCDEGGRGMFGTEA